MNKSFTKGSRGKLFNFFNVNRKGQPPLFLLLIASITALGMILPPVYLVLRATQSGVDEFLSILTRSRTLETIFNTLSMVAGITLLAVLVAVPLAFLTTRTDLPGKRFWLVATTLPLAIPTYVGSFALLAFAGPRGSVLQIILEPLGVDRLPSVYGWFGVVIVIGLLTYPYIMLTVRAALLGMNPSLEEAARSLGYSQRQTFFRITFPQLKPAIASGSLLVALYSIQDFGTPAMLRFDSFTRVIFTQYRAAFDRTLAAALALVLMLLVMGILLLEFKLRRAGATYYTTSSGAMKPPTIIPLGRWKWVALLFVSLIVFLTLVIPVGVILFWLFRSTLFGGVGYTSFQAVPLWEIVWNSIYAAGLGALVATIFAIPIAILSVRFRNRFTTILERCSYIGFGTPGIVIALALVFFSSSYAQFIYQEMPMLVFAYLVLFLPQAVGTIRGSLLQVNPSLEESAHSLGRNSWQTFREITLPLVRPGIISGAMLIFLTAMKELPATLILAPIGFKTLATQIWQATAEDAAFATAAEASLLILMISSVSTWIILSQEKKAS